MPKANKIDYDPQPPKLIVALKDKNIVQIDCGTNHAIALDSAGAMYAWGAGGYGRLGLNDIPPKDVTVPQQILGFSDRGNPVKKVACGSTFSMCIDTRSDALYLWGKWKNSGDGGQGTPWLYPKLFSGLSGWVVADISAGNNVLFALSENSTISWGQNAYHGELGHGEKKPKSATNAVLVDDLEGTRVVSVAAGLGNTLLLLEDKEKFESLPVAGESVLVDPNPHLKVDTKPKSPKKTSPVKPTSPLKSPVSPQKSPTKRAGSPVMNGSPKRA